ncbi:MAG TPA: hydantoinase B/oxoprolinase family protein [Thermomicrobiales bacterium]|nr:hydantoinase B/oxoprolinase family protein [Thermomicrobiales bacterium]
MANQPTVEAIDAVTLSVINNAFVNVCREMGAAMMRTSYSPIFNEGLDFSCMLFNTRGDLIGQAEFCPTMLGSCQYAMKWMLDEVGLDAFGPGDVFIHNDPYRGQCHMPEHLVIKAVFHDGKPWGFVGNIAHVGEIGGMAPGSFAADATEVYQEGLRLPPLKIMAGGDYVKDVWRIVLANHRTPKTTWGDYHAMIGSLHVAEARVQELLAKYGAARLTAASDQLLDYSERFMRAEIAAMPDGVYYAQDCMEDDGITRDPYWMRLRLTIRGDEAICDWTDSDAQARGPINATFVVTAASCYSGFLHVVSDDIPINAGCYRPIRLVTRPGTLVNVKHPGPSVGGNTETHPHIQNVVLRALAGAVPERVQAAEGASACNFLFGGVHPDYGGYYTNYHIEGSGWGGTIDHDGNDVQCPNNGNCRNTPVEILETKYPFLVEEYRLRPDSGGAGAFRGGLASSRTFRVTAPEIVVNALFDRTRTQAAGIFGGGPGASGGIFIQRAGDDRFRTFSEAFGTASDSKFTRVVVTAGDRIRLESAGGGGYGDPRERSPDLLRADVRQGFVSAAARDRYGRAEEDTE